MISPLQQELELEKAEQGKDSDHIDAITKDEDAQDDAKAQDKNYFPKGFL